MQCCVPSCENTSEKSRITFHRFPSDMHLHAAWFRALSKQDTHQPDPGVVCSLHFLDDDIYETEGCVRQIRSDAIPTTVLICMMCLDTDSKLVPTSKHQLEEVYQLLTGQPLCETANLQQTLCVLCAQRLIHFRTFRHMSLRARSLIMDLVKKYKLITMQQVKTMKQATKELKSNLVSVALAPDHCDLYIYQSDADPQTELEQPVVADVAAVVKAEERWDIPTDCVDIKTEHNNQADNLNNDSFEIKPETLEIKPENKDIFTCSISEFVQENQICVMCLDTDSKLVPMSKHQLEEEYQLLTGQTLFQLCETANLQQTLCVLCAQRLIHFRTFRHMSLRARSLIMDLVQKYKLITMQHVEIMKQTTKELKSNLVSVALAPDHCDLYIYQSDADPQTELEQPVVADVAAVVKAEERWDIPTDCVDIKTEYDYQDGNFNTSSVSNDEPETLVQNHVPQFLDSACPSVTPLSENIIKATKEAFVIQESKQILDVKTKEVKFKLSQSDTKMPTDISRFTNCVVVLCDINKKYKKVVLNDNNTTPPYSCDICNFKCAILNSLIRHKMTHASEKPYSCKVCSYTCKQNYILKRHMKTHAGEMPYSCDICNYKTVRKSDLVRHKVTHTGERRYSCDICDHKFALKNNLIEHKLTHTGERPHTCDICNFKFARKNNLAKHKLTHSGEKPYSCDMCDYKTVRNCDLVRHKLTHTGKRPYSCDICDYKFAHKNNLVAHKVIHTGERPYTCDICNFKFARKSNLAKHKRTHSGEKSYSCDMCNYKTVQKNRLAKHKLTHTRFAALLT